MPQVDANYDANAVLSPNPHTLHVLWTEYIHGVGNNKPAKFFTSAERGRKENKCRYSRRKYVWRCIEGLVRSGLSSHEAIDRIYTHYGPGKSVTNIINALRADKNNLPVMLRS